MQILVINVKWINEIVEIKIFLSGQTTVQNIKKVFVLVIDINILLGSTTRYSAAKI